MIRQSALPRQDLHSGQLNSSLVGLKCTKCGRLWPVADYFFGCHDCMEADHPANVAPCFSEFPTLRTLQDAANWLAYPGNALLGEGNTPLIDLPDLAVRAGVARLAVKNESANPTGSHKDRMSAALVRRALDVGAKTLAVASSGNAGASLAAFAARKGLRCVVATTEGIGPRWRKAIDFHGATIIIAPNAAARWDIVAAHAMTGEWYPATNFAIPAVGSNPFAIDGLRAIALELYLARLNDQPTDIVVPVSRADLLWGLAKGYADLVSAGLLANSPRIHAAEPFPRISRALRGEDYIGEFHGQSPFSSLGGTTVTYQAIAALDTSHGAAVSPSIDKTLAAQAELAKAGLFVESSSAVVLSGLDVLRRQGVIGEDASVVLIATSHGYKEGA